MPFILIALGNHDLHVRRFFQTSCCKETYFQTPTLFLSCVSGGDDGLGIGIP